MYTFEIKILTEIIMVNCKICKSNSIEIFNTTVLNKHLAKYFKCPSCGFIQTEEPYWLSEAYNSAISTLDTGLADRNISLSKRFEQILDKSFDINAKFLDYAGGYGLFVRLMRDKGYDFWWYDKYCNNIFSQDFCYKELESTFECITAIEVFEHLEEPHEFVKDLFQYTDSILFTTQLIPSNEIHSADDWWYFTPITGQHISFYSPESLTIIAKENDANIYTDNTNIHLLTKKSFKDNPVKKVKKSFINKLLAKALNDKVKKKKSLIEADYKLAEKKIINTDPN